LAILDPLSFIVLLYCNVVSGQL